MLLSKIREKRGRRKLSIVEGTKHTHTHILLDGLVIKIDEKIKAYLVNVRISLRCLSSWEHGHLVNWRFSKKYYSSLALWFLYIFFCQFLI